jgi:lipoate---protein ligase
MVWRIIETGKRKAAENMALDAALLEDLVEEKEPILHLYDWVNDAATYGHFIDPEKFLNLEGVERLGLDLAKRPTGGGITFHNCDLAFSILIPSTHAFFSQNPLENYAFVNERVMWAIGRMKELPAQLLTEESEPLDEHCSRFCMANPTKYDVLIQGKKVGGAAQRKTRHGFLHQGSISLGMLPEKYLRQVLAPQTHVLEAMRQNSFALLGDEWTPQDLEEARRILKQYLKEAFNTLA